MRKTKGLLLAGGHGTRLRPLTYAGNKHLLPIANKPMLLYGLGHLKNAGIREIAVVLGPIREGVRELLGDGTNFDVKVTYLEQPDPKGIAHAVMIAEDFVGEESFVVYLGDNLLKEGVSRFRRIFEERKADCVPLIGVYVFSPSVFHAVKEIEPSSRGELEVTDAIRVMLREGRKIQVERTEGWWKDTGRPEDLLEANQLVLASLETKIEGEVSRETQFTGSVAIGRGTKAIGTVTLRGPIIIGENCRIGPNVHIGPYTSIGDDCVLRNVEIENSIVMKGCAIESGKRIIDSLIGSFSIIENSQARIQQGHKFIVGERSFAQV
ncbi:MAG: glucose-1-phosphate thymidylyltransferase [Thaumarchaeota archaeon]|nr:MAG: glucose-1-phosphate thymidylyltransferase [Nitrososphaerota archaeon]